MNWLDKLSTEILAKDTREKVQKATPRAYNFRRLIGMSRYKPTHERVSSLLRGPVVVLMHHKCPDKVIINFVEQVAKYIDCDDEAKFVKRAKYVLTVPMALYLRNDAPGEPDVGFKPTGAWRRWSRSRLLNYCRKNTHLWFSFLQSKRAAEPLSPGFVLQSYEEHREKMLGVDPILENEETLDAIMYLLHPVIERIREDLPKELKKSSGMTHAASESACFEFTRKQGGQKGQLLERFQEYLQRRADAQMAGFEAHLRKPRESNTLQMEDDPALFQRMSDRQHDVVRRSYRTRLAGSTSGHSVDLKVDIPSVRSEYFDAAALKQWPQFIQSATDFDFQTSGGRFDAKIQAVLEPLKCRIISKGPAAPYYFGKFAQKALHTVMRRMPCFRLIGRQACATDLIDIAVKDGDHSWFSGDYKASTDALSAELSAFIMFAIFDGMIDDRQLEWLLAVLAPHRIHYPVCDGVQLESVDQQTGQLMGSIMSFPILCLANLGLTLLTVLGAPHEGPEGCFDSLYDQSMKSRDRSVYKLLKRVLINGDDLLFCATQTQFDDHARLGTRIGLEMSVGKTYFHKRYANINSISYDYDLSNEGSTPWKVGFFNAGLFFGQNKVQERVGEGEEADEGVDEELEKAPHIAVINTLLEDCRPGRRTRKNVLRSYLSLHGSAISKEAKGRTLFLPQSYGGFGVGIPEGFNPRLTVAQFAYACAVQHTIKSNGLRVTQMQRPAQTNFYDSLSQAVVPWGGSTPARLLKRMRRSGKAPIGGSTFAAFFRNADGTGVRWRRWLNSKRFNLCPHAGL
jgi:hypothetical protein